MAKIIEFSVIIKDESGDVITSNTSERTIPYIEEVEAQGFRAAFHELLDSQKFTQRKRMPRAKMKKDSSSETTLNFGHLGCVGLTASREFCKLWGIQGNRETDDKCFFS